MKKTAILALLVSAVLLSGCDFFRSIAGRPTSEDIKVKREAVQLHKAALAAQEQARKDSLRLVQKAVQDSVDAVRALEEKNVKILPLSELGGVNGDFTSAYCIIVGSFRTGVNAERMASKIEAAGYVPVVLRFRNGMSAVSVFPCNRIAELAAAYDKVKSEKFCPDDAWILKNN